MNSLVEKPFTALAADPTLPFLSSANPGAAARSVSLSATWHNCAASSPVLRSPNALIFSTRLALVNEGLMPAGEQVAMANSNKHLRPRTSDVTHTFELPHGSATVSVRPLQRRCVLAIELTSKTTDEVAAVRAVFRSITELLGAEREPVVAMQTGQSVA